MFGRSILRWVVVGSGYQHEKISSYCISRSFPPSNLTHLLSPPLHFTLLFSQEFVHNSLKLTINPQIFLFRNEIDREANFRVLIFYVWVAIMDTPERSQIGTPVSKFEVFFFDFFATSLLYFDLICSYYS